MKVKMPKVKLKVKMPKVKLRMPRIKLRFILIALPILGAFLLALMLWQDKPADEQYVDQEVSHPPSATVKLNPCGIDKSIIVTHKRWVTVKRRIARISSVETPCRFIWEKDDASMRTMLALIAVRPNGDDSLTQFHGRLPSGKIVHADFESLAGKILWLDFRLDNRESLDRLPMKIFFRPDQVTGKSGEG
tara:strand:+ start:1258 stop:1827 length:570 start_codon:yes stop_codon:yes gene_type:complete